MSICEVEVTNIGEQPFLGFAREMSTCTTGLDWSLSLDSLGTSGTAINKALALLNNLDRVASRSVKEPSFGTLVVVAKKESIHSRDL